MADEFEGCDEPTLTQMVSLKFRDCIVCCIYDRRRCSIASHEAIEYRYPSVPI